MAWEEDCRRMDVRQLDHAVPSDLAPLKIVQAVVLDIAKVFAGVCEENGLRYSLFLGSLLGAVRHQGFIPWDDDMDFAMPREDFERFVAIAPEALPSRYRLRHFSQEGYPRYVTRIEDTETLVRLESYQTGNDLPIWLDIFVLDGAFDSSVQRSIHNARILCKKGLWAISAFDEVVNLNRPGRPAYQQAIINTCRVVNPGALLDTRKRLLKLDDEVKRAGWNASDRVFCAATAYSAEQATWFKEDYEQLTPLDFADTQFFGPVNYDRVLRQTYGDYHELPPVESREIHHVDLVRVPDRYL